MTVHQGRTALYRVFNRAGGLLYIGISHNPDVRLGQHSQTKDWWSEVHERRIERFDARSDAETAERRAIEGERPIWNLRHAVYEPADDEAARLYARRKRHHDALVELDTPVREQAARDLLAGATPGQLAKLTGLSDEFFRRIARAVGAERKRKPTVGREAESRHPG